MIILNQRSAVNKNRNNYCIIFAIIIKYEYEKRDMMFSEYDTFIYHGYKLTKDDDGIFIEYNFEIPSLAFFHPTERIKTENLMTSG